MASIEAVMETISRLDVAWPRVMTDEAKAERALLYSEALSDLSDEEVIAAGKLATQRERFFPAPGVLREFVQPKSVRAVGVQERAAKAYAEVLECHSTRMRPGVRFLPHDGGGARWSYRQIAEEVGKAAAEAFIAAGGHEAFAATDPVGDQFRFKRFVEAFALAAEAEDKNGQLEAAGVKPRELDRGEAAAAMARIEAHDNGVSASGYTDGYRDDELL
jgi:hypothetical protein